MVQDVLDSLQGVHAESLVHAGAVGEECSQGSLEDQAKVQRPVAHSLVHDRVTAGLADDQIGPLHHHDRHEEGRVAGELEALAVPICLKGGGYLLASMVAVRETLLLTHS